jgi:hypothetical protein
VKRNNPDTGLPFKRGDVRQDGYIFFTYVKTKVKADGFYKEKWLSPEAAARQIRSQEEAGKAWRSVVCPARREAASAYKLEKGCERCGYKEFACALDFDHLDPAQKSFDISARIDFGSPALVEAEMAKCRVLCANCHRAVSAGLVA